MIIRIYRTGAEVIFTEDEAAEKIEYENVDPNDKSLRGLSSEERDEEIRRKMAYFAVINNISWSMKIDGWKCSGGEDFTRKNNATYEYVTGNVKGEVIKEVRTGLYREMLCAVDFYCSELYDPDDFGGPHANYFEKISKVMDAVNGKTIESDEKNGTEWENPDKSKAGCGIYSGKLARHLYGGTATVPELKNYIPDDLTDAVIYIMDNRYYIVGDSMMPGDADKKLSPLYVTEHGKVYADKEKTAEILELLM